MLRDTTPDAQGDDALARADRLFDAALECMAQGDAPAAAGLLKRAVQIAPGHVEATHGLIRALEDSGQLDEALHTAQKLIASHPEDVLALTSLSIIYQHKGMIAEAENAAAKAKIMGWKEQLRSGVESKSDL
jgi:tetratricopeptide (TPR) repeat protein